MRFSRFVLLACSASLIGGCVAGPRPANLAHATWMPQQQVHAADGAQICMHAPTALPAMPAGTALVATELLLAPGDRLRLDVIGDAERISGTYVIGDDGRLEINGIGSVSATGLTLAALEQSLRAELVAQEIVQPLRNAVRLSLLESGGVSVAVSGAVFAPGTIRAGVRSPEDRIGQREGLAHGDANNGRTAANALRAAGGVRPDADLRQIGLVRQDQLFVLDMRAAHDGASVSDILLAPGDRLIVPSTGCFDAALVRPSLVTQPGIRVYMSNLTRPANNNAGSAVGIETSSLPYGTRFLQGLVAMNCVGGSAMNAGRRAVLISRNPMTGDSVVIERDVEELVRSAERDRLDPYLMPGDSLACYESRWMNLSDAISMVSNVAGTATTAIVLSKANN
jgi:protein involved in polysaccharide export with SLBB domain